MFDNSIVPFKVTKKVYQYADQFGITDSRLKNDSVQFSE